MLTICVASSASYLSCRCESSIPFWIELRLSQTLYKFQVMPIESSRMGWIHFGDFGLIINNFGCGEFARCSLNSTNQVMCVRRIFTQELCESQYYSISCILSLFRNLQDSKSFEFEWILFIIRFLCALWLLRHRNHMIGTSIDPAS